MTETKHAPARSAAAKPAQAKPDGDAPQRPQVLPQVLPKTDWRRVHGPFDIIGDVHGCADELVALLEKLGYCVRLEGEGAGRRAVTQAPDGRRAFFVGDLVDRGPKSPDVLRIVMDLVARGHAFAVIGNHDDKFLRWLKGHDVKMAHGLERTAAQYADEDPAFRDKTRAFLESLPSYAWLEDGRLVVAHAGLKERMLGRNTAEVRRFCLFGDSSGKLDAAGLPERFNWAADYHGAPMILYGHTPVVEAERVNNTVCLDTGCVFGGKLTALRWPEQELVSVPALERIRAAAPRLRPAPAARRPRKQAEHHPLRGGEAFARAHRSAIRPHPKHQGACSLRNPKHPMAKPNKDARPSARLPKGLRDIEAAELRAQTAMIDKIRAVYERYGFEPLETPAFEYTDALGKFLPDQDRPNEGVFSFQDVVPEARGGKNSEQWLSLRYDLTAPLARYVAQNFQTLTKPFRRYAVGPVWRNEKPGPGRFRQFLQFDADTVGTDSVAADAEMCMLAADTLEALGIKRGDYVIKVNNRKLLDGLRESVGLSDSQFDGQWLVAMRALDKLDRLGGDAVRHLLGKGRKDESGDFTPGAMLSDAAINRVLSFTGWAEPGSSSASTLGNSAVTIANFETAVSESQVGRAGVQDLKEITELVEAAGYGADRIRIDPSVIRGLEYYTGPVFEAELTFEVKDDKGNPVRFGSVGGGGRYDGLVERFTGQKVPATGFSIGISRLQAALAVLNKDAPAAADGPVIVTVMEKERLADYQKMVQALREAGIRAEFYLGNPKKFGKQLEYADKRGSPCVVIQGSDEREAGEVTLKDLIEGAKAAAAIANHEEWKETRAAQVSVKEADLVKEVRAILARHTS